MKSSKSISISIRTNLTSTCTNSFWHQHEWGHNSIGSTGQIFIKMETSLICLKIHRNIQTSESDEHQMKYTLLFFQYCILPMLLEYKISLFCSSNFLWSNQVLVLDSNLAKLWTWEIAFNVPWPTQFQATCELKGPKIGRWLPQTHLIIKNLIIQDALKSTEMNDTLLKCK